MSRAPAPSFGTLERGWASLGTLGSYIQSVGVMKAGKVGLHGHGVWLILHKCQSSPPPGGKRQVGEKHLRETGGGDLKGNAHCARTWWLSPEPWPGPWR